MDEGRETPSVGSDVEPDNQEPEIHKEDVEQQAHDELENLKGEVPAEGPETEQAEKPEESDEEPEEISAFRDLKEFLIDKGAEYIVENPEMLDKLDKVLAVMTFPPASFFLDDEEEKMVEDTREDIKTSKEKIDLVLNLGEFGKDIAKDQVKEKLHELLEGSDEGVIATINTMMEAVTTVLQDIEKLDEKFKKKQEEKEGKKA
ncbi:hypothetical protein ACFL21_00375 [Patescibacteria group bacterium]